MPPLSVLCNTMPRLRLFLVPALIVTAFVAGYKLRPRLNVETFYTAYAK